LVNIMSQPCPVPFRNCSQRIGNVAWAQHLQWESIKLWLADGRGEPDSLCLSVDVPRGTTVDDFLAAIGRVVSRHEVLRTRFRLVDGCLVTQEVVGSGSVDVTRCRPGAGDTSLDALLRRQIGTTMIDVVNGFPFRAAFVATAGEVTHVAFAVSRVIADAAGCENLTSSFLSELSAVAGSPDRPGPEPTFQQIDQAEWEASAEGRRAERAALHFWQRQLEIIASLPQPRVLDGGALRTVAVPAQAFLGAAEGIARISAASSSAVVLTAFLQATAHVFGLDRLGVYLHCSNRPDPQRRASVTRLKNLTIFTFSPDVADFRSTLREVFRSSLAAYRHAQSPGELFLFRLAVAPETAPFVHFNDVRSIVASPDGPARELDPDEPLVPSIASQNGYHPDPILDLGVGRIVGSASKDPVLKIETNLLHADDVLLLLERMRGVIASQPVQDSRNPTGHAR
jgi:hypothetical protein